MGEHSTNLSVKESTGGDTGNVVLNMKRNNTDKYHWQKIEPIISTMTGVEVNTTGLGTEAPQTISKHIAEVFLSNTLSPYKNQ